MSNYHTKLLSLISYSKETLDLVLRIHLDGNCLFKAIAKVGLNQLST